MSASGHESGDWCVSSAWLEYIMKDSLRSRPEGCVREQMHVIISCVRGIGVWIAARAPWPE
eukprot:12584228-Prorocentrum_lima.AAC.1